MNIDFYKYDGAGNDFILIDARHKEISLSEKQIAHLCHRRYGIGADGLMTLHEGDEGYDFRMRYYNSDGREATMCGNGGRCITVFARQQDIVPADGESYRFMGPDGEHRASILVWNDEAKMGIVRLGMRDVERATIEALDIPLTATGDDIVHGWRLDTGSPHFVVRVADVEQCDVVGLGRYLRHRTDFFANGTNVDFIADNADGTLAVRTYERGVEDETLACGTGITACALVTGNHRLRSRGGDFKVDFDASDTAYTNIQLTGPVAYNFCGKVWV